MIARKLCFHLVQTGFKLPESLIKPTGKCDVSSDLYIITYSLTCRTFNVESTSIDGEKDESSSKEERKDFVALREKMFHFIIKRRQTDILYYHKNKYLYWTITQTW